MNKFSLLLDDVSQEWQGQGLLNIVKIYIRSRGFSYKIYLGPVAHVIWKNYA